jgi:hypothetical protein
MVKNINIQGEYPTKTCCGYDKMSLLIMLGLTQPAVLPAVFYFDVHYQ